MLVVPNSLMMTEETAHASDSLKGVTAADPFCRQVVRWLPTARVP